MAGITELCGVKMAPMTSSKTCAATTKSPTTSGDVTPVHVRTGTPECGAMYDYCSFVIVFIFIYFDDRCVFEIEHKSR